MVWPLGLVLFLAACQTPDPGKPPAGPAPASKPVSPGKPAPAKACPRRVAELKRWMATWMDLPTWPRFFEVSLVSRPKTPWLTTSALALVVTPKRVTLEGVAVAAGSMGAGPIKKLTDLLRKHRVRLDKIRKMTRGKMDHRLDRIHLLVDPKATWATVAAVATTLRAEGVKRVGLVFDVPYKVEKPGPSPMDRQIDRLKKLPQPARRQEELARLWTEMVRPCPPLAEGFAALAAADPSRRQSSMHAMVPAALLRCSCAVDIPQFKTLLFATIFADIPKGVIWVTLDPKGKRVRLPAATPWSSAYEKLLTEAKGGQAVDLQVGR